jgi:glucan phosphoethanolaminetransferase (alkaline phosphatase superfamily)
MEKYLQKSDSLGISNSVKKEYFNSIDYKNVNKKNIIIIFIDSARAANFSMYGYERDTTPFLNSLYKDGKLAKVDYFFSTCPESVCGAISVFSSKSRKNFDIYNASNEILLQNILHELGYKNYFISSCNQGASKWKGLKQSYAEDFDLLIDSNTKTKNGEVELKGGDDKLALFGVNQIPDSDGTPIFTTFWLFSAHHNGKKEKEFYIFNPTEEINNIKDYIAGKIKNTEALVNRYDNGLVQTDYYISQIFEVLKKKGHLDNSLVFITGDHGDALGEDGYYGHGFHLTNNQIKVPLLIYSSDGLELKNYDFASQIDISPTILDVLNINPPKQWEGLSLLGDSKEISNIHELVFSKKEKVLIMEKDDKLYKYFYVSNKEGPFDDSAEQRIYELYSDPYEQNNIINSISKDLKNEIKREFIEKFDLAKMISL